MKQISKKEIYGMRRLSADIRVQMINALQEVGSGHIGGSASIADVLAVLYGGVMRINPDSPNWENRDWLVLSKGHCGPSLYAALAIKGYFPMEWLKTINKPDTRLPSHADRIRTPGVDMSTGSLGQGISCAVGIAIANKMKQKSNYVYCIVGDGELNEGQIWEACGTASHYKLDQFFLLIDWNKKQLDGKLEEVLDPISIPAKLKSFGFDTYVVKGYDVEEIYRSILNARVVKDKPHAIILDTYKGLGINFAEQAEFNHYMTCTKEQARLAIDEIEKRYCDGTYPRGDLRW